MNEINDKSMNNEALIEKILINRKKALKHKGKKSIEGLEKPVAFWIKRDRLLNEIGKEFTIILRTRGCDWALGKTGGCSMCGYIQDAYKDTVPPENILSQFNFALESKMHDIEYDNTNYVLKIFNSGSFFDEQEIDKTLRVSLYNIIANIPKIKEVVIESRIEYIDREKLEEIKTHLKDKYIEIGIGLETVNDYIRNNYINKGISFKEFQEVFKLCKEYEVGVKAYILFKPPFLNEIGAIEDCTNSIRTLINMGINSISINPINIQRGSLVEYLWYQKRYRPPWYYSLFTCLKNAVKQEDLENIRILCDPSGAGTKRGIHNCLKKDCNGKMKNTLENFVLNQDVRELYNDEFNCSCKLNYKLKITYL